MSSSVRETGYVCITTKSLFEALNIISQRDEIVSHMPDPFIL